MTNIKNHNGFNFEYYINDSLGVTIFEKENIWEPHILKFVKIYNEKFNIKNILDIGANIGYHTLHFANEISNNGFVYAFEPSNTKLSIIKK